MEDYVVGSEMKIGDILGAADVGPLLKAMVAMGAGFASVTDEKGIFLFSDGDGDLYDTMQLSTSIIKDMTILSYEGSDWQLCPLNYEGGPIGFLIATIPDSVSKESLTRLMEIVSASLNI